MLLGRSTAKYWNDFVSLIYPRICSGCGSDVLTDQHLLCWSCLHALPFTNFEHQRNNPVENIFTGRIPIEKASSLLYFGKNSIVQRLIHQLKYKGNKSLGTLLGNMIGEAIRNAGWQEQIDFIVPMPLNKRKEMRRGFNQAGILAAGVSEIISKPVATNAVIRNIFTETQTVKSRTERWKNMEQAFMLTDKNALENKHILLIDDIVTTGATLEACGQILLQAQNTTLSIATLAFASKI